MPYWKLCYHFDWGTKNRMPLIDSDLEPEIYRAIVAKAQKLGGFVHAIGGLEDHVHLAVSIPPKFAPAKFIGDVKGNSSHFVNYIIKPDFEFRWQSEYGVISFGERNLTSVVRYIHNQKQHHADGTLIATLEKMDEMYFAWGDLWRGIVRLTINRRATPTKTAKAASPTFYLVRAVYKATTKN